MRRSDVEQAIFRTDLVSGERDRGQCAAVAYVVLFDAPSRQSSAAGPSKRLTLEKIPFDGTQAYEYLQDLCAGLAVVVRLA